MLNHFVSFSDLFLTVCVFKRHGINWYVCTDQGDKDWEKPNFWLFFITTQKKFGITPNLVITLYYYMAAIVRLL